MESDESRAIKTRRAYFSFLLLLLPSNEKEKKNKIIRADDDSMSLYMLLLLFVCAGASKAYINDRVACTALDPPF
jgi:hypothetical protein